MKKLLPLLILAMGLFSCTKSNQEIVASHEWKGGCLGVGDWLDFSAKPNDTTLYTLSHDTILKNGRVVAIITTVYYKIDHYNMNVTSLQTGQECLYFEKGNVD